MIQFSHPKEKEILLHYAGLLGNDAVKEWLNTGVIDNPNQVKAIAQFYWQIVNTSIEEEQADKVSFDTMDMWLERIYTSLHIYFNNNGWESQWEAEIPED